MKSSPRHEFRATNTLGGDLPDREGLTAGSFIPEIARTFREKASLSSTVGGEREPTTNSEIALHIWSDADVPQSERVGGTQPGDCGRVSPNSSIYAATNFEMCSIEKILRRSVRVTLRVIGGINAA